MNNIKNINHKDKKLQNKKRIQKNLLKITKQMNIIKNFEDTVTVY